MYCTNSFVFIIHVFLMDIIYIFHHSYLSKGLVHIFIVNVLQTYLSLNNSCIAIFFLCFHNSCFANKYFVFIIHVFLMDIIYIFHH